MIVSMTGYGRAEGSFEKKKYSIEIRSVNNRFCEIAFKYPKYLATKDFELKEIVRNKISRGKININLFAESEDDKLTNFSVDENSIKEYYKLLNKINDLIGSKDVITIEHMLHFTNLFTSEVDGEINEGEFKFISNLLKTALDDLKKMKIKEGESLEKDILNRIKFIQKESKIISRLSKDRVEIERERLLTRVMSLVSDKNILNENRLEIEVTLLADKIDITEELIRLGSHTKYFIEYTKSDELAGRRLNFLIQEINREVNTIASKSLDAEISQRAAVMKEELEKVREQLQNIE